MNRRHLIHALGLSLGLIAACGAVAEPRGLGEQSEPGLALERDAEPGEVAVADFAMF